MARSNLNRSEKPEPGDFSRRLHLAFRQQARQPRKRWQKILLWFYLGSTALFLLLGIAIGVLLQSERGQRFILAKVDAAASQATGARIHVHDFALHLGALRLDLNGVVIHGTEPDTAPPLLQADHIGVSVRVISLLHRKWNLSNIIIDHPVAHISVDAQGRNNFPTPPQKSSSNTSIFDLAIQRFLLDRGEIYYNDRKSLLDADLREVNLETSFENAARRYYGTLEYQNGVVQSGNLRPVVHDFHAKFSITASQFTLEEAVLKTGASRATLQATLENFNAPLVNAKYDIILHTEDAGHALKNSSLPVGVLHFTGTARYQTQPDLPPLKGLLLAGDVSSPALAVKMPSFQGEVRSFAAKYRLFSGNAEVEEMHAQVLGGSVSGKLTVRDLAGAAQGSLQAVVQNISLAEASKASGNRTARQAGITGKVGADLDASWHGALKDLAARSNATLNATVAPNGAGTNNVQPIPLDGVIHAQYSAQGNQLTLRQSYLRSSQTQMILDGTASANSNLQIRVQSNDLHELEIVSDQFRATEPGQPPAPLDLYGKANFSGALSGRISDPQLEGQLAATDFRLRGSAWRTVRGKISIASSQVNLTNGELESATQGHIALSASIGLNHWAYTSQNPIKLNVSATRLSLDDIARVAGRQLPATGTLTLQAALHGTQLNPMGQGSIALSHAMVEGESVQALNVRFDGNGDAVHAVLQVQIPAGTAKGDVTYHPRTQAYEGQLEAQNIHLDQIQALKAKSMQLTGVMNLTAKGRGTLQAPELEASVQIPELQVQKETIHDFSFSTKIENQIATITLNSQAVGTYVRASGKIGLTGDYRADLQLDTGKISLQPLLATYAPEQASDMAGETELHATLHGPLKDKAHLMVHAEIPQLSVTYKQLEVGAATPIRFDYQGGTVKIAHSVIKGTGTNLEIEGSVPIGSSAPMSLQAQGTLDLRLAQMISAGLSSSGEMQFDLHARGNESDPNVQGQIRIVDANLQEQDAPLGLAKANGVLTLANNRLEITSFSGNVGGGTIEAKGGMTYRQNPQLDIGVSAKDVRLRYPDGLRTILSGDLSLTGTPQAAQIGGQVRVDRISLTPDFDLSNFANQFTGEESAPSTSPFMEALRLNIGLQTTSGVNLTSSKVSVQGSANLRVAGTAADPVILGRASLTGGDLFFMGNRYVIQGGTISFLNPVHTEPVVNLRVSTVVQEYNINLNFRGPVDRLETSYSSDPALPPVDIINLLAFGSTTEASGSTTGSSGSLGNLGAESVLAQGVSGQLSSRVEKLAGISHLSVDPVLNGSNNENPGARITLQQRVTGNLYVTFQTDVTSTQREVIEGEYQINKKWSVTATRDQNGGFGVDGRYHKEF